MAKEFNTERFFQLSSKGFLDDSIPVLFERLQPLMDEEFKGLFLTLLVYQLQDPAYETIEDIRKTLYLVLLLLDKE